MDHMLSRQVLEHRHTGSSTVAFGGLRDGYHYLDKGVWESMGRPEHITIAIWPGVRQDVMDRPTTDFCPGATVELEVLETEGSDPIVVIDPADDLSPEGGGHWSAGREAWNAVMPSEAALQAIADGILVEDDITPEQAAAALGDAPHISPDDPLGTEAGRINLRAALEGFGFQIPKEDP